METVIFVFVLFGLGASFVGLLFLPRAMCEAERAASGRKRPRIAKIVLGVGAAALIGAVGFSLYALWFSHVAERADGIVLEMRERAENESERVTYAPRFRFHDRNGVAHTVDSSFSSYPPEFQAGDQVRVLYLEADPQSARIDSRWQLWGIPRLMGILSGIYLLVGSAILFWPRSVGCFKRQRLEEA